MKLPANVRVDLRGMVNGMCSRSAGFAHRALALGRAAVPDSGGAVRSFKDPLLIMLAIPMGFIGVLVILPLTHTTLNVMSLMGRCLMLVGIAGIQQHPDVEFAHQPGREADQVRREIASITSCRGAAAPPFWMTSLPPSVGACCPWTLSSERCRASEQYAPLALAIIRAHRSVVLTVLWCRAYVAGKYRNRPRYQSMKSARPRLFATSRSLWPRRNQSR